MPLTHRHWSAAPRPVCTVRTGEPSCGARRRVALHHLPDLLDRLVDAQTLREVLPEGGVSRLSPKAPVEALTSLILV
jgi:hypothetical protein